MAAMREAFGDGERSVVKSILAQITAGEDEHRAKEVACETVANLLMANKLLYALSPNDAIWQTLARNVFPDAPKPENTSYWGKIAPMPMPANDMDYFYMMGARHRRAWRGSGWTIWTRRSRSTAGRTAAPAARMTRRGPSSPASHGLSGQKRRSSK